MNLCCQKQHVPPQYTIPTKQLPKLGYPPKQKYIDSEVTNQSRTNLIQRGSHVLLNPIRNKISFGQYNNYRLDPYFDLQTDSQQGQLIKVASANSNSLHLQEGFINMLEKYKSYQLVFIGMYGKRGSGKSLFLDKILNLATFGGSHVLSFFTFQFTKFNKGKQKGLYTWSVPVLTTQSKRKIFLIDCVGFQDDRALDRQQQMMLDFYLVLCSEIAIITTPKNIEIQSTQLSSVYRHFKESSLRLLYQKSKANKDSFYWPNKIYLAQRQASGPGFNCPDFLKMFQEVQNFQLGDALNSKYSSKDYSKNSERLKQVSLTEFFDTSKKLINERYLKRASLWLKNLSKNASLKTFNEIDFKGGSLSTILINLVQNLNIKNQKINIDYIFQASKKEILIESYNETTKWYDRYLSKELNGEDAKSNEQMFKIFRKLYFKGFTYFDKIVTKDISKTQATKGEIEEMEKQLEKYIRGKQLIVTQINKKKSIKRIKGKISTSLKIENMPMKHDVEVRQAIYRTKGVQRNLDCGRLDGIKDTMIQVWDKYTHAQEQQEKRQIRDLQSEIQERVKRKNQLSQKNHLLRMRGNQDFIKYQDLKNRETDLETKLQNTKMQVMIVRKKIEQNLQSSLDKIYRTAESQQQLISQLKKYYARLNQNYKQKINQCKALRQDLQEAQRLQSQQFKYDHLPTAFQQDKNVTSILRSRKEILEKNNEKPQQKNLLSQIQAKQKNYNSLSNKLIGSRIGKTDENVNLLKKRLTQKVKVQASLRERLAQNYSKLNLTKVNPLIKNNIKRSAQSRPISNKTLALSTKNMLG